MKILANVMHTVDISCGIPRNEKAVGWRLAAAKGHSIWTGTIIMIIIIKIRDTPHIAVKIPITVLVVMMLLWWEEILANHTGKSWWQGKIWWISYSQFICQIHFCVSVNIGKENFANSSCMIHQICQNFPPTNISCV